MKPIPHIARLTLVAAPLLFLLSCVKPPRVRAATPPASPASQQDPAERALRTFRQATFYKPKDDPEVGVAMTYAPLIVQEVDATQGATEARNFGAVLPSPTRVDPRRPVIYFTSSTVRIGGMQRDQVVYLWRYPCERDEPQCVSQRGRGVRITLAADGTPLVWEALSTDEPRRVLFVSHSLEDAARREFGAPPDGRRFSIERAPADAPDEFVARVLDDGPVPMGPYVYLGASPRREITAILCRCMPSQVDEFVTTGYYEIQPLETIAPLVAASRGDGNGLPPIRWAATMTWENIWAQEGQSLDSMLRWPASAP